MNELRQKALAAWLMIVVLLLWMMIFKHASAAWDALGWKDRCAIWFLFALFDLAYVVSKAVTR